jgi:hypothetical protein
MVNMVQAMGMIPGNNGGSAAFELVLREELRHCYRTEIVGSSGLALDRDDNY